MFLTLFIPFFSALTILFFGRYFGQNGTKFFANLNMGLTFFSTIYLINEVILKKQTIIIKLGSWFRIGNLNIDWVFLFDNLSVGMLFTVTLVSSLVHLYSCYYMATDPHLSRFLGYLSLFTFFMLFLVTANNFLQLFIGWEGVGLCSYLLINFWYTRIQANKSAMKAVILNRVGDCALLLAISLILYIFKSLDFHLVFSLVSLFSKESFFFFGYSINFLGIIGFLLFIAAVGKSAQIGLHTWLPDAMEGPTPVSALIHAATMVTAGVFLIIRCSIIFEYTPNLLNFMTIVGAFTAFLAASSAAFQNDIKKIIAYSTCSQLGYMVMACSVSQYSVAVFHLINHAFFKALLFLGAGIIIHALSGEQDMRRMGGLLKILPLTYITMLIASFALTGFPFLAGFYSKEIILGSLFCANTFISTFAYWIGLISAMLTSFYSAKILYLVFIATPKGFRISYLYAHTTPFIALFPLIVLSFFSITSGFLLKDAFIGIGTQFFDGIIFSVSNNHKIGDIEQMPSWLKILTIFIGLFGFIWFTFKHFFFNFNKKKVRSILLFFSNKWYFDLIYNELIVNSVYSWSYFVGYKLIDKGIIELLGPSISTKLSLIFSNFISNSQNGWISSYIRVMLLSFIFINFYCY